MVLSMVQSSQFSGSGSGSEYVKYVKVKLIEQGEKFWHRLKKRTKKVHKNFIRFVVTKATGQVPTPAQLKMILADANVVNTDVITVRELFQWLEIQMTSESVPMIGEKKKKQLPSAAASKKK